MTDDELLAKLREMSEKRSESKTCPSCGHCPVCGHTPRTLTPWYPTYPRYVPTTYPGTQFTYTSTAAPETCNTIRITNNAS